MTITDLTLARPGLRPTTKEPWVLRGACRDQAPHWDSDAHEDDRRTAMQACLEQCPVRDLCTEAGRDEPEGIWGGVDKAHPSFKAYSKPRPPRIGRDEQLARMSAASQQKAKEEAAQFLIDVELLVATGATLNDAALSLDRKPQTISKRLRALCRTDLHIALTNNQKAAS